MKRRTFTNFRWLVLLALTANWRELSLAESPATNKTERRYQQGPLTAEDFRGLPPATDAKRGRGLEFSAFLDTAVRWTFRYKFDKKLETGRDGYQVEATEIDVYAAMLPYSSFNSLPHDRNLLDHEQGHFDITEIYALEIKFKLREMIQQGEIPKFTSNTEAEGAEKIRNELQRLVEQSKGILSERQRTYDEKTDHGNLYAAQRLARQEHFAQLNALQERLRKLESPKSK